MLTISIQQRVVEKGFRVFWEFEGFAGREERLANDNQLTFALN
jgi:hypothetical protein